MRSLPKLIPGIHPKLPGRRPGRRQGDLRARRGAPDRAQPLHQGRGGRRGRAGRAPRRPRRDRAGADEEAAPDEPSMKVAYWPGCVCRGFTTELHGSMALVAERLGIELVELDRANCSRRRRDRRAQPGAGRHPQRPHLRARPADRAADDEHLLDLPGRPVGVPAAPRRRLAPTAPTSTRRWPAEGLSYEQRGLHQQELPLGAGRGLRAGQARRAGPAAARGPARSAPSTAATSCAPSTGSATTSTPSATSTSSR